MSWVKPVATAAFLLLSAVGIGYTVLRNRQQTRLTPNHEYTYNHQRKKKERQCSICLKEMNSSEEVTLPCGHSFCSKCLRPLYLGTQTSCCVCRKELDVEDLNVLKRKLLRLR